MSDIKCERCGDSLTYVTAPFNRWIHLSLPIAQAWTHEPRPVEAGSGGAPGAAGAPVPARPHPPTLSGGAAAELTFGEDEPA
jgi:hypothetical protein